MTRVRQQGVEGAGVRGPSMAMSTFNRSDWLPACVSAFGNRCDVFKQVGITGMSSILPLYPTLNVLSPAGKLSPGHMLHSHITLTSWLPAPHQHPMQPLPNPLPDHQLSCPHMGVTFTTSPRSPLPAMPRCCSSQNGSESLVHSVAVGGGNLCK